MPFFKRPRPPYLPSVVEPSPTAQIVESHDAVDITYLCEDLRDLDELDQAALHAAVFTTGLMRSRVLSFALWIATKRSPDVGRFKLMARWLARPQSAVMLSKLTASLIDHMNNGHDREDANSIGGFSTRELQFIANVVALIRDHHATVHAAATEAVFAQVEAEQTDAGKAPPPKPQEPAFRTVEVAAEYGNGTVMAIARVVNDEDSDRWYGGRAHHVEAKTDISDLTAEERLNIANKLLCDPNARPRVGRDPYDWRYLPI